MTRIEMWREVCRGLWLFSPTILDNLNIYIGMTGKTWREWADSVIELARRIEL